jgi:NAD+ synthase (glutamine-hydrolysing)
LEEPIVSNVRIASAFVNQTPLDWAGNETRLRQALRAAREAGAAFLCLPELAITGYGCEDLFLSPAFRQKAWDQLQKLLSETRGLVTVLGLPLEVEGGVFNTVAVCHDGKLLGLVPKQNLARDGVHYEPRWFKAWIPGRVTQVQGIPTGDLTFPIGDVTLGIEICEDAWVGPRPAIGLKARGANLIFCPAASHFAFGKTKVRRALAVAAGLPYVYSNLMGNESGRIIFDGGASITDAAGRLVAEGQRFSYQPFGLCVAELPLQGASAQPALSCQSFEDEPHEEFARAVALGLYDYLRKSKAKGFALSLSGGADSAACAVLLRLMAELGSQELGWPAFSQSLGLSAPDLKAAMPKLLRTLYQGTVHSSQTTRSAAAAVAQAVGAAHGEVDIQPLYDAYKKMTEGVLGRSLQFPQDDLALQNLQARVRSPGIWALANAEGRLLLATNNRSEGAAGYTTMDGDTSGGLAPIAGLGKHQLRDWLRWMEKTGLKGLSPWPVLAAVNAQAPTAELRPLEQGQTDEADLMPYEALDAIERAAIADRLSPAEVLAAVAKPLAAYPAAERKAWVIRFFKLWAANQWKRERLAPSFHLDDHNVDPRSWTRFPILSGAWAEELERL